MVLFLPAFTKQYGRDGVGVHIVFPCKVGVGVHKHVCADTNIPHLIPGKFRVFPAVATKRAEIMIGLAGEYVSRIVGMGARIQVGRIDTSAVPAFLEYQPPFGDSPVSKFVRDAVRGQRGGKAIACVFVNATHPRPARFVIGLLHDVPKVIRNDMVVLHVNGLSCATPSVVPATRGLSSILSDNSNGVALAAILYRTKDGDPHAH